MSHETDTPSTERAFVIQMDRNELAVLILESLTGMKRPVPSAVASLARTGLDERRGAYNAADAAMKYFDECFHAAQAVQ